MFAKHNKNYWIAMFLCLSTKVLALMGKDGMENIKWFILSDINVAIYLFVAWFFDYKK